MLQALNRSTNTKFIFKCIRERNNFFTIHYLNNYFEHETILDENGDDVLTNIIKFGTAQMITYVLGIRFGCSITMDSYDINGVHILFHAAKRSDLDLETIRTIYIRANMDFNMRNNQYGSLLNQCIASKNIRAISIMMNFGIDVNATDENGDPVIFRCVTHGLLEISNLIINNDDFDVDLTNSFNESILEVALLKNMLIHGSMIIKKMPRDLYSREQTLKLMEICIDKKNTMMAWKLYSTHSSIVIQKRVRGFLTRLKYARLTDR